MLARRHRLFWRTAGAILALLTLAVTLPAGVRIGTQARRARAELIDRTIATANVAASTVADLLGHQDTRALSNLVAVLAALDHDVDVAVVVDKTGRIVADASREHEGTVRPDFAAVPLQPVVDETVRTSGGTAICTGGNDYFALAEAVLVWGITPPWNYWNAEVARIWDERFHGAVTPKLRLAFSVSSTSPSK